MSACSVESIDELTQTLLKQGAQITIKIEHDASDDVMPALLAKANQLAEANKPVLVVCADDAAARRNRARLDAYPALDAGSVLSMREVCLDIVSDEYVQNFIDRDARVLDDNEHDVLLEDIKVCGLKPRRLREMLKFFYRSMSEYADEQDDWLISTEEQMVYAILTENLEVRRAMLPCELPSLAYRGLVSAGVERRPLTVLVDDYATLSKAAQRLIDQLATAGLIVAGSTLAAPNVDEPYPFYEGFTAFATTHDSETIVLADTRARAVRSCTPCSDPSDELAFVADAVVQHIKAGVQPCDMLVAVPGATQGTQIARALKERGVPTCQSGFSTKIKGDPRTVGRFAELKLATFLQLYRNPDDFTSLRSWLGMGDWLLRSDAFLELMAFAREREMTVPESIALLRTMDDAERPTQIFGKFDEPLDELNELMHACANSTRKEAIALFAQHGMMLDECRIALLGADPTHANIERLASYAFANPGDVDTGINAHAVSVVPHRACHGRFARVVFITGLVNGFLPANDAVDDSFTIDHRQGALARDRALFDDIVALARDEVACSYYKRDRLDSAGTSHVQISRVYIKDAARYAAVIPSEFASSIN